MISNRPIKRPGLRLLAHSLFPALLTIILLAQATAQSKRQITSEISPGKAHIGDLLRYRVTVEHKPGAAIELLMDDKFSQFDVRHVERSTRSLNESLQQTAITVTLAPFAIGRLRLSGIELMEKQSGAEQRLAVPPAEVAVEPLAGPQDRELKDVKPVPSRMHEGYVRLALLAMLAATALAYRAVKWSLDGVTPIEIVLLKRLWIFLATLAGAPRMAKQEATGLSLEDEAISRLRKLIGSKMAETDVKRFHIELADTMSRYLIKRYALGQYQYTTGELLQSLRQKEIHQSLIARFEDIFNTCDLVKFARFRPEPARSLEMVRNAIKLLLDLKSS